MRIAAGIPYWQDGQQCLDACIDALRPWVDEIIAVDGPLAGVDRHGLAEQSDYQPPETTYVQPGDVLTWATQAAKFNYIVRVAKRKQCDWLLKVDADEILHHGDRLRTMLETVTKRGWSAFPLPVMYHPNAAAPVVHACKLIRLDCWIRYTHCNVLEGANGEVQVIGQPLHPEHTPHQAGLPYLVHRPELREGVRATIRLSEIEDEIEQIPEGLTQWQTPTLT